MLYEMNVRMGGSHENPTQTNVRDDLLEILWVYWTQHEDLCSLEKPACTDQHPERILGFFFRQFTSIDDGSNVYM